MQKIGGIRIVPLFYKDLPPNHYKSYWFYFYWMKIMNMVCYFWGCKNWYRKKKKIEINGNWFRIELFYPFHKEYVLCCHRCKSGIGLMGFYKGNLLQRLRRKKWN